MILEKFKKSFEWSNGAKNWGAVQIVGCVVWVQVVGCIEKLFFGSVSKTFSSHLFIIERKFEIFTVYDTVQAEFEKFTP